MAFKLPAELNDHVTKIEKILIKAQLPYSSTIGESRGKGGLVNLERFLGLAGSVGARRHC